MLAVTRRLEATEDVLCRNTPFALFVHLQVADMTGTSMSRD